MTRRMTITDYGKDYGFGRYNVTTMGLNLSYDNFKDVIWVVRGFEDNEDFENGCQCVECTKNYLAGLPLHDSDCTVHNMPAYPNGECDCVEIAKGG